MKKKKKIPSANSYYISVLRFLQPKRNYVPTAIIFE